jgi:hypothetical protein
MKSGILIEISPGELLDRITILRLKLGHARDAERRHQFQKELDHLTARQAQSVPASPELNRLLADLAAVNTSLWDIEDELRECEKCGEFGERFVELARSVYQSNDHRMVLRQRINRCLGRDSAPEKVYRTQDKPVSD